MHLTAYLRERAVELRRFADAQTDPDVRRELLALADECERLANQTAGNGRSRS